MYHRSPLFAVPVCRLTDAAVTSRSDESMATASDALLQYMDGNDFGCLRVRNPQMHGTAVCSAHTLYGTLLPHVTYRRCPQVLLAYFEPQFCSNCCCCVYQTLASKIVFFCV